MLIACWVAVIKAGGVAVSTMPMLRTKELDVIVQKGQISLVLCDEKLKEEMEPLLGSSSFLSRMVCYRDSELERLMKNKSTNFKNVDTANDDVAILGFTSGTTGSPKATIHFHRDILAVSDTFSKYILEPSSDDVFCATPPIAFTFGLGGSVIFPFHARATVLTLEDPNPKKLIDQIIKYNVTTLLTAPTAYRMMLSQIQTNPDIKLPIHTGVSAGEALPKATSDAWHEATNIRLIDGIGATELLHIFISASGGDIRPGSTGKPVPGYRACLLDDQDRPLPLGSTGRLAVKGPTGCRYMADDRQANYVINGWNVTGDIYATDEDGYYWYISRSDDMIISSGYNIAAVDVENGILGHPSVLECAVVGLPDKKRGNIVKAFIVLKEGYVAGEDLSGNIQTYVKESIAPYKYPRLIEFVACLPKTKTGKLQRFKLRS